MRSGYCSDQYFVRIREVPLADGHRPNVMIQVFARLPAFRGGIDEAIGLVARRASPGIDTKLTTR